MNALELHHEVSQFIGLEARLLDQRRWQAWLALFAEDVVYWVPAWATESELTADPRNELSMIYIRGRGGLEDRIFRIESGDSFASDPLDRTAHVIGSVAARPGEGTDIEAEAGWICHSFGSRGSRTLAGQYDYTLRRTGEGLRIARKRVVLIDDKLEGPVDIYHI